MPTTEAWYKANPLVGALALAGLLGSGSFLVTTLQHNAADIKALEISRAADQAALQRLTRDVDDLRADVRTLLRRLPIRERGEGSSN